MLLFFSLRSLPTGNMWFFPAASWLEPARSSLIFRRPWPYTQPAPIGRSLLWKASLIFPNCRFCVSEYWRSCRTLARTRETNVLNAFILAFTLVRLFSIDPAPILTRDPAITPFSGSQRLPGTPLGLDEIKVTKTVNLVDFVAENSD